MNVPTAVLPQLNSTVTNLDFSAVFSSSWQRGKEQDRPQYQIRQGRKKSHRDESLLSANPYRLSTAFLAKTERCLEESLPETQN